MSLKMTVFVATMLVALCGLLIIATTVATTTFSKSVQSNANCTGSSNDTSCANSTSPCLPNEYLCDNQECVPESDVCNGVASCQDGSDESPHACLTLPCDKTTQWRCTYSKRCINISVICSGTSQCASTAVPGDNSDQSQDACNFEPSAFLFRGYCTESQVKCGTTNKCVDLTQVCDGFPDCCLNKGSGNATKAHRHNATFYGHCEITDELGCFLNDATHSCSINKGGCSESCRETQVTQGSAVGVQGYDCTCPPGYKVNASDQLSCVDIDECAVPWMNNCTFTCVNTKGSYQCPCPQAYAQSSIIPQPDNSAYYPAGDSCRSSTDDSQRLIYLFQNDIYQYDDLEGTSTLVYQSSDITAVDVDFRNGSLYFFEAKSNAKSGKIRLLVENDPAYPMTLNVTGLGLVADLAVDFVANNLYIADNSVASMTKNYFQIALGKSNEQKMSSRILVTTLDSRYQRTVMLNTIPSQKIVAMAINPLTGWMYYVLTNVGTAGQTLSFLIMAPMSGVGPQDSAQAEVIYSAAASITTVVIDLLANRLYFAVGSQIYIANPDGSGLSSVSVTSNQPAMSSNMSFKSLSPSGSTRSFDVFEALLEGILTGDSSQLYIVDKFGRLPAVNLTQDSLDSNANSVRISHPLKAGVQSSWPKSCQSSACSHLCLLSPDEWTGPTAVCACPDGATLDHDGKTCLDN